MKIPPTKSYSISYTPPDVPSANSSKKNFWDIGAYSIPLKRLESSSSSVNELINMFEERATIEAKYGKSLVEWYEKWSKYVHSQVENSPDDSLFYGTSRNSIESFVESSGDKGKAHIDNWTQIHAGCMEPLREFNDETFTKNFNSLREVKGFKDDFRTAQQPYIEALQKFKKAQTKYFALVDSLKANTSTLEPQDELDNLNINDKKRKQLDRKKKQYEERYQQLQILIPHYIEKMNEIYDKLDVIERRKLTTIKKAFENIYLINRMDQNQRNTESLKSQERALKAFNIDSDLEWWSTIHGPKSEFDMHKIDERKPPSSKIMRSQTVKEGCTEQYPLVQESTENIVFK